MKRDFTLEEAGKGKIKTLPQSKVEEWEKRHGENIEGIHQSRPTPENQLLDTLFGGLTEEETKYLNWLLNRVNSGKYTPLEAGDRFRKRFPNSKWLPENR